MKRIIIAIDGPAASGKSTSAKLLARKLGYVYLDTGAMYRACALAAQQQQININDIQALSRLMENIRIHIQFSDHGNTIWLNDDDVSEAIREPDISRLASAISAHRVVRTKMVKLQRELGREGGVILDGRDIGTVVFPQAELKFFMIAPLKIRAQRRYLELKEKGLNPVFEDILQDLVNRDKADASRALAPLIPAEDAIEIDTGELTIAEQVEKLYRIYLEKVGS
ncbi:MAG: hypothetical protein PWP64_353 [Candidatus Cloacimonadota bacterium]|nr:hypothetical protein [Candidatus Cloacimonadota bacterium]